MIWEPTKDHIFTPKWNGNAEAPKHEQMSVVINHPSFTEANEAFKETGDDIPNLTFLLYVKEVKNFKIGKVLKRKAKPIDLLKERGLADLVNEIRAECDRYVVDKKK